MNGVGINNTSTILALLLVFLYFFNTAIGALLRN